MARLALFGAATLVLAGCAEEGFRVARGTGGAPVVLQAGGARIAVTPPEGFCVDAESVQPQGTAAFVLIEDCALMRDPASIYDGNAAANLPIPRPAVINGLVTLSVGNAPLFADPSGREAGFAGLETFLRSDQGRATAGMGGDAASIRIVETRRTPDSLYVLVEDRGDRVVPVLGDRFWRAFTEVRERAVIASLGVFDATAMNDERKLAHLARVVAALREGNREPVTAEERRLADGAPEPVSAAVASAVQTPPPGPDAEDGPSEAASPAPPPRPGAVRVATPAPAARAPSRSESDLAPARTPPPPPRA